MTVKCRKKVPINGLTLAFFARDAADVRSIRYILFSGFRKDPIHICLFFCHCPMDLLVCSGKYCIFEYPTHICLFVSPSLSPVHLLVCSVGTSVWVVRWPSTAGGWRLRVCIFAKWKRAPKKRNQVKRGKKYGLLGTHFHFPWTFTLSLFQLCKAFLCF